MKNLLIKQLFQSVKAGQKKLGALTSGQRSRLEKAWDIEHAYYSSTLEGSKMDRKEFEKLGEEVQ
ncbi:hypothetical protein A3H75_01370 [Candidatus Uhrbacteria bacterium RIFCSPLOWO2_02_FULL_51_9]|uniref:Uncharacterized protein n=1 Tax=Candidatus Uhrbacteria bacterium RIFCSPLOWO2_02_FULL_51_9 TaxID=1802410 RepID=A0A1F7VG70_9BACT|nr:MAG: hypothetical protein A3H75_01370 [Candidatus Uhrbacteria bacterium RIFCSPLOWO2_02_FULL_51_9]